MRQLWSLFSLCVASLRVSTLLLLLLLMVVTSDFMCFSSSAALPAPVITLLGAMAEPLSACVTEEET